MGWLVTVFHAGKHTCVPPTDRSTDFRNLQVLSNLVNFKTFGFTKIIPRVTPEKFEAAVKQSENATKALGLWNDVSGNNYKPSATLNLRKLKEHIYALTPESNLFIGKRSLGHISNYYLGQPISDNEVASVQAAAEKIGVDVLNTRYVWDTWL